MVALKHNPVPADDVNTSREMTAPLECGTNLAELLSSALPPQDKKLEPLLGQRPPSPPPAPHANGGGKLHHAENQLSKL